MTHRKASPPRGILRSGVADSTRYRYVRYHAPRDLAVYIEHFWLVEWDLRGREPELAETLPHPSVHIIFEPDGKSHVRGPSRSKFSRVLKDRGGIFAVKFTPAGFRPFAKAAVRTLTDKTVSLRELFGPQGDALDRAILSESGDAPRVALIEKFLRGRNSAFDENVPGVSEMVYSVANDRSILSVEHLADRYAYTIRTLQRLFATYVGVSPKWVIQRYRLHEAAALLSEGRSIKYAALAADLGYSDQAHFVRDFKGIVGMTPAAYAKAVQKHGSPGRSLQETWTPTDR
jgi:AraC-like DNA-binding protein